MSSKITCRSTPTISTGEVQLEVLSKFRTIDKNDESYLNKTIKASDELEAFVYAETEAMRLHRGVKEDIESTFEKERSAKLEYQDDALFQRSTEDDYDVLSVSPHTSLPTKLLELRPLDRDDILSKIYIRFVTESILYNVALGYAEDVIKLEYGEVQAYLTIKDLLILFLFCEGQVHGYFPTPKKNQLIDPSVKIPKNVILTVPYKKTFDPIPDYYHWRNIERYTPYILSIIPDELTLTSETYRVWNDAEHRYTLRQILPSQAEGVYYLTNPDESKDKWKWVSDNGSSIYYKQHETGAGRWVFSFSTGEESIQTYSAVQIPYWNWLFWQPNLVYNNERGEDISTTDASIKVTKFHYAMDDKMPTYETTSYINYEDTDDSLVHLIDKQADGFVSMYHEYMLSGWSRQHAGFLEILDSRTFKGIVDLNLSPYETFYEHFQSSSDMTDILAGIKDLNETARNDEYTYLADTIIKLLYPIDSKYLIDSNLQLRGMITRLKDLVVDLCSYNVAWVADPNAFGNNILDGLGNNTMDVVKIAYGMESSSKVTETHSCLTIGNVIVDKWCYDEIYTKKYVIDTDLPEDERTIRLIDSLTPHECIDHQYIITSIIHESMRTIVADIEMGYNDCAIRNVFVVVFHLPKSLSLLEYDSSYVYCRPTTATQQSLVLTTTKQQPINI